MPRSCCIDCQSCWADDSCVRGLFSAAKPSLFRAPFRRLLSLMSHGLPVRPACSRPVDSSSSTRSCLGPVVPLSLHPLVVPLSVLKCWTDCRCAGSRVGRLRSPLGLTCPLRCCREDMGLEFAGDQCLLSPLDPAQFPGCQPPLTSIVISMACRNNSK